MGKYIKPISETKIEEAFLEKLKGNRFIYSKYLSSSDLNGIVNHYQNLDVIRFNPGDFENVNSLQACLIEEIQKEYPYKRMDKFTYLDETLENLDHYYNMNWVILIENWDSLEGSAYIRFLNGILKNGILKNRIKLVVVTGEKNIQEVGFSNFMTV